MTRILITGASGFVGRAVCKSLRVAGYSLSGTTSNIEQAPHRKYSRYLA